jgi:hypothetical protein
LDVASGSTVGGVTERRVAKPAFPRHGTDEVADPAVPPKFQPEKKTGYVPSI